MMPWRMEHSCAIKRSFRSLRIYWSCRLPVVAAFLVVPALRSFRLPVVPAFRSFHLYCFSSIAYCPNNRLLIMRYWAKTETHRLKVDDKTMKEINVDQRVPTTMSNFCQVLDPVPTSFLIAHSLYKLKLVKFFQTVERQNYNNYGQL